MRKKILGILLSLSIVIGNMGIALATESTPEASSGEEVSAEQDTFDAASLQIPTSVVKTGFVPQTLSAPPELVAQSAIVVDMQSGYTLYEKNIQTQHYPASITKIMTATLALEKLKMEDIVTFSHNAVYSIEPGSSSAYAREGEQFTVEQCLYGLMLISGNDLANGLGEAVAGTTEAFADMMTQKAKDLGCIGTQFKNPHGLHDEGHYTTAYDMAIIAINAYKNLEMFKTLCSTIRYDVPPTPLCEETRYWLNTNRMIRPGEEYYYEDCMGGKTGYTDQAGGTLVTFAKLGEREVMCVILKSNNSVGAYEDSIKLYNYVKQNITAEDYAALDNKAAEDESKAQALLESLNPTTTQPESTTPKETQGDEKKDAKNKIFGVVTKVLLVVVIVFLAFYAYVRYQRHQARLRRLERRRRMRMRQKMENQRRQRR